jgi:hypothetical protein
MKAPPRTQGIIAAGLMAILTLSVFAPLTYSGPESSLKRYHEGIATGDLEAVKQASLQDPANGPARELLRQVEALMANSQQFRVFRIQREGRSAVVEMMYVTQQFGPVVIPFYMRKPVDRWKVDADRTWGLAARARIGPG